MANDIRTERRPKVYDSTKKMGDASDYKPRIGEVMDNIDPGHMGKVWVYIEATGRDKTNRDNWKMVSYASPFYGTTNLENNSKGFEFCNTQQAYGMWMNPPDVGTLVLIIFVDGNPDNAWVIGYIPDAYMTHMLPGMASSKFWSEGVVNKAKLSPFKGKSLPVAEYNKKEDKIAGTFKKTLKAVHMPQFEMLKEQGLIEDEKRGLTTSSAQRESPSRVFGISTPGRPLDLKAKNDPIKENLTELCKTPQNIPDGKIKIWNRKGGHTFVMDDGDAKEDNQLLRFRSASGHQILLNDTDDLIYIANAKGTAWIEINDTGGIDIFSTESITMHTDKDFNFDCLGDFKLDAGGSVKIKASKTIDLEAIDYTAVTSASYSVTTVAMDNNVSAAYKLTTASTDHNVSGAYKLTTASTEHSVGGTYKLTPANMDLFVSGSYNREVVGTTTENYGILFRQHIGGNTFFTTGPGIDFTPSDLCVVRTTAPLTPCIAPASPASAGVAVLALVVPVIPTNDAERVQATSATATTGLKWAPDGTLVTIVNRLPQHEPWSRVDAPPSPPPST